MLKPIKGFEGYLISSEDGKIYSNVKGKKMFPLKTYTKPDGYLAVSLWDTSKRGQKKRKTFLVHRLVAETFISNPENKPTVNHIDGVKTNNCIDNLEWATMHEQNVHSFENGLNYARKGEEANRAKLNWDAVHFIRNNYPDYSVAQLAAKFDISDSTIYAILYNYTWVDNDYNPKTKGLTTRKKIPLELQNKVLELSKNYNGKEIAMMLNISQSSVSIIKKRGGK